MLKKNALITKKVKVSLGTESYLSKVLNDRD